MIRLITAFLVFVMPVISVTVDQTEAPEITYDVIDEDHDPPNSGFGFENGGTWRAKSDGS